jgi:DNA adenine methylase
LPRLLEVVARLGGIEPHQTYHEPFMGGGALYHALAPAKARLNDASPELVRCIRAIQVDAPAVLSALTSLVASFPGHTDRPAQQVYYNNIRALFNAKHDNDAVHAGAMIFLNRTCFNGLWRVNASGEFNASLGRYKKPAFPGATDLDAVAARLFSTVITLGNYSTALDATRRGDLAFLDPPYGGVQGEAGFTAYTAGGFGVGQQRWLVEVIRILHARGVRVILTNGDFPGNRAAYEAAGLTVECLNEMRRINTDTTARGAVPCLLAWSRHAAT